MKKLMIGILFLGGLWASCSETWVGDRAEPLNTARVAIEPKEYQVEGMIAVLPGEREIQDMQVYHFADGRLAHSFVGLKPSENSVYQLDVTGLSGNLYFLANAEGKVDLSGMSVAMEEKDFLKLAAGNAGGRGNLMTGYLTLSSGQSDYDLKMTRGVARVDLRMSAQNTKVLDIRVENVAQQGFVWPQNQVSMPEGVEYSMAYKQFTHPLETDSAGLFYFSEQVNDGLELVLTVNVRGQEKVLKGKLPTVLKRNTVYVVRLTGRDAVDLMMKVEEWESGDDIVVKPDLGKVIRVDPRYSVLPEGVVIRHEAEYDVVDVPYYPTEMSLALKAAAEVELFKVGGNEDIVLLPQEGEVSGTVQNSFRIQTKLRVPGKPGEEVVYRIKYKHLNRMYEDKLVFNLKENANRFDGLLDFDEMWTCDLKRYVDNELGTVTVADGNALTVRWEDESSPWLKAEPLDDIPGKYRIVAGWRPNDAEADGREQRAEIVITRPDGKEEEVYTVKRRNYGLPVTLMNGVYWCKYNARGNVRDFSDQILVPEDPAVLRGQTVLEYLNTCSPEEYFDLWNWSYEGGTGIGMQAIVNGGLLKIDGFKNNEAIHINKVEPKTLAPDGYELASRDDYDRVFQNYWMPTDRDGGPYNVLAPWEGNKQVFVRAGNRTDLTLDGLHLPSTNHFEVYDKSGNEMQESVTFYGPGSQWNGNGVNHNMILFASYSSDGGGWFNAFGNYGLARNEANASHTRVVRWVKSSVEYIY